MGGRYSLGPAAAERVQLYMRVPRALARRLRLVRAAWPALTQNAVLTMLLERGLKDLPEDADAALALAKRAGE